LAEDLEYGGTSGCEIFLTVSEGARAPCAPPLAAPLLPVCFDGMCM